MDHHKTEHACTCKRCGKKFTVRTEFGPSDICGSCSHRIWLIFMGQSDEKVEEVR